MIPDIGLMIGAYTITRLAAMLGQPTVNTNPDFSHVGSGLQ